MSSTTKTQEHILAQLKDDYKYGFHDPETSVYKAEPGINESVVRTISSMKNEPEWMLKMRLEALRVFFEKPLPQWGGNLNDIDFNRIHYYVKPSEKTVSDWDKVPEDIKRTFDRLGIPEAERRFLAGVGAQYDSEVVYHNIRRDLQKQGVVFLGMDDGLRQHPDIVKKYFATVVPIRDNKFAALNSAVWSGGSFVYVPKGVRVDIPLQAYFRINTRNVGQFERTLIIAEPGSFVHYVEGCTAPIYSSDSLHVAVVELIALPGSRIRYTTIQNWSNNVYNLVTKRAFAYENAAVEWIDGNLGSRLTMKYPSVVLMGKGARGEVLSVAMAGRGQHQDAGAKIIHVAPDTSSRITSKSISKNGGRTTYRGMIKVLKGAKNVKSNVVCDALILDPMSASDTVPYMDIAESDVSIGHEASVGKVSDEQLFYLMSRGLTGEEAMSQVVQGFIEPFIRLLPMEYAVELNRLIELQMEGSVG